MLFSQKPSINKDAEANEARLFEQIGNLQMQNEWLKKIVMKCCLAERRQIIVQVLIDKYFLEHPHSGVLTFCALFVHEWAIRPM